jgi:hypothetical protein
MTEQQRAKPELWTAAEKFGRNPMDLVNCILELRARVEALEAAQHAHADLSHLSKAERRDLLESLATPSRVLPLEAAQQPTAPATDSLTTANDLVRRVAIAIHDAPNGHGWENEARAAIKEVAAWIREYERVHAEAAWAECLEQAITLS